MRGVIETQYRSDEEVQNDKLLRSFFKQVADKAHGDIRAFPPLPESREMLIDVLTRIIWQMSGFHSALNFS